jgi:hypothetical protein
MGKRKQKQKQTLSLESREPETSAAQAEPSWRLFGLNFYRLPWFVYLVLTLLATLASSAAIVAASGIFNMHLGLIDQVSLGFTAWVFGVVGLSVRSSNGARSNISPQILFFVGVVAFSVCKIALAIIGALITP